MWIVRELLRLLSHIALAVAIATVIAGVKAAVSGGGTHTWKITLLGLGCLMLLLAMTGNRGSASNRRVNSGIDHAANFVMRIPGVPVPTDGPTLTENAVFALSACALFALAFVA